MPIPIVPVPAAHFLQWYSHLVPDDQSMLRYFLEDWLKPQPEKQWVRTTPVIDVFLQGYSQLSQNDQQILCDFLRSWLKPHPPLPGNVYGGVFASLAPQEHPSSTVTCPFCKRNFEINHH